MKKRCPIFTLSFMFRTGRSSLMKGFLSACFLITVLTGCKKQEITVYRVPKENRASMALPDAKDGSSVPAGNISWTVPAGWQQQAGSAMRQASFRVTGKNGKQADMSVVVFPGDAGGTLANINRWRGQLNLPAVNETEMARLTEKLKGNGREFVIVNMAGPKLQDNADSPSRLLGAILHQGDQSWFFKMMGDDHVVTEQKSSFLAFLKSVQFPTETANATGPKSVPVAAADTPPRKIHWKVPTGWREQPAQGMRQGSFLIVGKDARQADVSIISLPGTAGGTLANVNMWRSQLALPPTVEGDLARCTSQIRIADHSVTLVDLVSASPVIDGKYRGRISAAILPQDDQTWFFKLSGEDSLVGKEKAAFLEFVKSVRFSDDS